MHSKSNSTQQWLLVAAALVLGTALYMAPKKVLDVVSAKKDNTHVGFDFNSYLSQMSASLKGDAATEIEKLTKENSESSLNQLAQQWDGQQQPLLAAHYYEASANKSNVEKSWLNAAYRYFDAFRVSADSNMQHYSIDHAIACYEKVLKLNPGNLNAKTDLGICYAEGTNNPMQGISLLREVIAVDSLHENAQFNLGILSVKSGQYEKAIDRFNKVLQINPDRKEMYYMIGRAYMMSGDKEKALINFEKVKNESKDEALVTETKKIIDQINN